MQGLEIGRNTVVMSYLGLGLMMALLDRVCMRWWFMGKVGMGKGSRVWLGEKGEDAGPNRSVEGDG